MLNFFINNWEALVIIAVILVGAIIGINLGFKKQIKAGILYLVTEAEKEYGSGTGELKYAAVSTWIYEKLPTLLRLFISASMIDDLIEWGVAQMKEYLSENASAAAIVSSGEDN